MFLLLMTIGCAPGPEKPTDDSSGPVDTGTGCDDAWYTDADGDGHGAGDVQEGCRPAGGTADAADDCDDTDAEVHPGASERCDERDEDCDGAVDEDALDAPTRYADADADGYGDPAAPDTSCAAGVGTVDDDTDCDDADAAVFPGAEERCDGLDDDCDDTVDEDAVDAPPWYADADGDGYGDGDPVFTCDGGAGWASTPGDCDDTDAAVTAGAPETCNGVDDDCDGVVDGGYDVPGTFPTIRDALAAAPAGALVCVAAGTWLETIDFAGVDREVRGVGAGLTVIDGGGVGPVVTVANGETAAMLADLTVTGGDAVSGAGIYVVGADLALENVSVNGNTCDDLECAGVGIYVESGTVEAEGLDVSANTMVCGDECKGVGVYADTATVTVEDAVFADNTGAGGDVILHGGAVYATGSGEVRITRGELYGNTLSATGPAAYAFGAGLMAYSGTVVTLANVRVADNEESSGDNCGSAITLDRVVDGYFTNVIISGNVADCPDAFGAAIGMSTRVDLVASNIDIRGHSSSRGGAFWVLDGYSTIALTNAIVTANDATTGGAIYLTDTDATVTISWSDIYDNGDAPYYHLTSPVGVDGNVEVDPVHVDVSAALSRSWDLHLDAASPLVDGGDPALTDPDGSTSDMGAYGGPGGDDW